MPLLVSALLGALISGLGTLVGRVLISLGISYVAYQGIDTMATFARDSFVTRVQSLPAMAIQLIGLLQIGTCVNILISAYLARLVVNGLTNGSLTKMVQK
jgi:hypothetical protein